MQCLFAKKLFKQMNCLVFFIIRKKYDYSSYVVKSYSVLVLGTGEHEKRAELVDFLTKIAGTTDKIKFELDKQTISMAAYQAQSALQYVVISMVKLSITVSSLAVFQAVTNLLH